MRALKFIPASIVEVTGRRFATFFHRYVLSRTSEAYDLRVISALQSSWSSAEYYSRHMLQALHFEDNKEFLVHAVRQSCVKGLYLEFGVAGGATLRTIAFEAQGTAYGFDSFRGLPEDWRPGFSQGTFAQKIPSLPRNVELIVGLFEETLPRFAVQHEGPISFMHIDCDLYSSTKVIFDHLGDRVVPGTIIAFDEYFNYTGWQHHEYKAFQEFVQWSGVRYSYVSLVPSRHQVCIRIEAVGADMRGASRLGVEAALGE